MDLVEAARDLDARLDRRVWGSAAEVWVCTQEGWLHLDEIRIEGHPATMLQRAWDEGVRVPHPGSLALGMAVEGWRALTLDEVAEVEPEFYEQLLDEAKQRVTLSPDLDLDLEELAEDSWRAVTDSTPSGLLPENLRVEVRNCAVIGKDGTQVYVIRDRDGDGPTTLPTIGPEQIDEARVPAYMHMFLNRRRPEE